MRSWGRGSGRERQGAMGVALRYIAQRFHLDSLPGAISQSTTDGAPSMTETYSLRVLEAGSLRPRCQLGWILPRAGKGNQFQASFLPSGDSLAIFGISWLLQHWPDLSIFTWCSFCMYACVQIFPFYKDIRRIGWRDHPNDLILTNYICKTLLPYKVTFWDWGIRTSHVNLGGHNSAHTTTKQLQQLLSNLQSIDNRKM